MRIIVPKILIDSSNRTINSAIHLFPASFCHLSPTADPLKHKMQFPFRKAANIPTTNLLLFLIQKRFLETSITTTLSGVSSSSSAVHFLVNSCGLPLKPAFWASRKCQLNEKSRQRVQSVVELLKSYHFNSTQIAELIERRPIVLNHRAGNLKPKLDFLVENGFAGQHLPELIIPNPGILTRALDSHLKPSLEFLKSYLDGDEKIVAAIKRSSWLLTTLNLKRNLQPKIDFLIKEGVPMNHIRKTLPYIPRMMLKGHDGVPCAVKAVRDLGLKPKAASFMHAVLVKVSMSEPTWNKKMELLKSFGWNEVEIVSLFKRCPYCLGCSESNIRNSMDFYLNTMKLEPKAVLTYPKLLLYSIDKRIRPRYNVLKILKSKKLIEEEKKVAWLLTLSEKTFVEEYAAKYADQVPGLLEIYIKTKMQNEGSCAKKKVW